MADIETKKVVLSYRKATIKDVSFLLDLRKQSMNKYLAEAGFETSEQYHLARVKEHFDDSLLIMLDNHRVGLLKLAYLSENIHVRQFQILPKFHNKGIGSKVLKMLKKKSQQLKQPITLNVLLNNPAKSLYLREGFIETDKNALEYKMRYLSE